MRSTTGLWQHSRGGLITATAHQLIITTNDRLILTLKVRAVWLEGSLTVSISSLAGSYTSLSQAVDALILQTLDFRSERGSATCMPLRTAWPTNVSLDWSQLKPNSAPRGLATDLGSCL
jgi:hypothetical protein